MKKDNLYILLTIFIIYVVIKFIPFGNYLLYPINLIVTFLHEFGHAFGALITGGSVKSIQINPDGSGLAVTSGGIRSIVLMGGYIGSAIFGNILLYYALVGKDNTAKNITMFLGGFMIILGIIWFHNITTTIILLIMGIALILISKKIKYDKIFLGFIGLASLFYIIEDFRVGPSSDLAKFSELWVIVPQFVWMYLWLFIVLFITYFNFRLVFKKK